MNDESLTAIERELAAGRVPAAPVELRRAVLGDVHRELSAARWDRRLTRAAAVLLAAGVCMNGALGWLSEPLAGRGGARLSAEASRAALVEQAVAVAESTDAATGGEFAIYYLASHHGAPLTEAESASLVAEVMRRLTDRSAKQREG